MEDRITTKIQDLESLDPDALRVRWAETHGAPPPPRMRRDFLLRGLAYRIQEDALGGLTKATRRRLMKLAAELERNPGASLTTAPPVKAGTRLVREWKGEAHQVTVLESGFEYRGERYRSLSEIARVITGTRWSGPRFFGLRENGADVREGRRGR